jgi:hypothetical protein
MKTLDTGGGFIRLQGIEARVASEFAARQQLGINKYGMTLAENNASEMERLQHLKEELMDGVAYIQWLMDLKMQHQDDGR